MLSGRYAREQMRILGVIMSLWNRSPALARDRLFPIPVKRLAETVFPSLLGLLLVFCAFAEGNISAAVKGDLAQNTTFDEAGSPYVIEEDLTVPAGIVLTVEPGARLLFKSGVSLIVEGEIQALGTVEKPILFSSAETDPQPGDWGQIRFVTADTTLSYDGDWNYVKGSRLDYCIIEYGGRPRKGTPKEFLGGAIHCRKSSPYLTNLIIRYNDSPQGGGIFCHEFASPYIAGCLFKENRADESGGGLGCFFYSNAVVKGNIFQANQAGEHGGGIYFSFSSPQIIDNIIENNRAEVHGGGLFCSNTVTQAVSRVRNNVFLSNRAKYQANSIYLTAKIETIFQDNCLLAGEGYDVYTDALEKDLDFRGNYFGPPSKTDLETRVFDSYDDPFQATVILDPVLESPPPEIPNAPSDISSFDLLGDAAYSSDWELPLCDGAPIYLEARAKDNNPYHPDWLPVRLRSSVSNPKGIVVLAWETGPSTGIFRLEGKIGSVSLPKESQIKARSGETVFFSIEGTEGFEISRPVDTPKSYIIALRLPEEADTLHVVSDRPLVTWAYRDIFGRKQENYQLQISEGSPFAPPPMWDSGELMGAVLKTRLADVSLQDGMTYTLRLRIFNGVTWSDWADLTMRMNSLPTVPQPLEPQNGRIIAQMRPELILEASSDAEGDPITYEIQLYQDPDFTRVLGIEKELRADGDRVRWTAPADLSDDAEYYWRARARDPYETGPWSKTGQFWVNLVEEPPLPFGLLDPEIGTEVYLLEPVFSWEETFDPDPLSSVRYRVSYTRNPQFTKASTITLETDGTFIKAVKPLHNENTYYWKVEAVDNTGRITVSDQTGSFYVNTTPTVPELLGPFAGEELHPEDKIAWNPSTDPNSDDQITYRLQMSRGDFNQPLLEETFPATGVTINELDGYCLLKDNVEYRFRVRAEDNHGIFSKWSQKTGLFFFNQVNDPPGPVAAPVQPNGIVVTEVQPIISWGAAQDPDRSDPPEKLSYLIQFDQDGDFSEGVRQVQVMAGVTRVAVPGLADNQEWFYRIRSRDDDGAVSSWSDPRRFILNTQNDPPLPFSLVEPADGWKTYHLTGITFSWEEARDPDPLDSLKYRFLLAPAAAESDIVVSKDVKGRSWKLDAELNNDTEYLWWVEAVDLAGLSTPSSEKRRFTVSTTPSVPTPHPLAGVVTGEELLRWDASADPDPNDRITYDLRITPAADPSVELSVLKGISSVRAAQGIPASSLPDLKSWEDNATYAFLVRAVDNHGAASAWSPPQEFYLDLVNEPPQAPSLTEPSAKLTRRTEITVSWSAALDPDPSDTPETMTYRLQVVPGDDFGGAEVQERAVLSGARSLTDLQLADNQLWSLRVRAEDRRGEVSPWSDPVELLVNIEEDPPSEPELKTPQDDAVILSTNPVEFSWAPSEDPDWDAEVHYELRWWAADNPDQVQSRQVTATSFTVNGLVGDRDYRWQVIAVDDTGLRTASRQGAFRVEIPNHPPKSFNLVFPENGQVELPPRFEFTWQPALDNDPGDEVRYTLYLSRDEYFQADLRTFSDLQGTKFALPVPLERGATYYWKVSARDLKGEVVWGSTSDQKPFRFTVILADAEQKGEGE